MQEVPSQPANACPVGLSLADRRAGTGATVHGLLGFHGQEPHALQAALQAGLVHRRLHCRLNNARPGWAPPLHHLGQGRFPPTPATHQPHWCVQKVFPVCEVQDDADLLFGVRPQPPPHALRVQGGGAGGAGHEDARHAAVVIPLRQDGHVAAGRGVTEAAGCWRYNHWMGSGGRAGLEEQGEAGSGIHGPMGCVALVRWVENRALWWAWRRKGSPMAKHHAMACHGHCKN